METPNLHIAKTKLKGTSLFFALTFTLIIAVTITSIIGLVFLHNEYINRNLFITERIELSGKAVQLSERGLDPSEINSLLSEINTTPDSMVVSEKQWGLYDLLKINFYNNSGIPIKSEVAMMGYNASETSKIGAFVKDEYNPIVVSGTTKLGGTSYLTKAEVKPGSIEGYGYRNKELLFGSKVIHQNEKSYAFSRALDIQSTFQNSVSNTSIAQDSIVQSFNEDALIIRGDTLLLSDIHIGGHVYLIANYAILIGSGVSIDNVIAIAPEIYIDSKEAIQIQAFSSKRLEVFDGTSILYPSALALIDLGGNPIPLLENKTAELTIGGNTTFEGILVGGKSVDNTALGKITIAESVDFKGYIFNEGPTELHSNIRGSVFTDRFEHISNSNKRYVNYLFDASINPDNISDIILHPDLLDFQTSKSVVTWLERS